MDIEITKKVIGLVFKSVREDLGISRAALAKGAGVNASLVRSFEDGQRDIKLKTFFALIRGLQIPTETIVNAIDAAMKNPEKWLAEYELGISQSNLKKFSK